MKEAKWRFVQQLLSQWRLLDVLAERLLGLLDHRGAHRHRHRRLAGSTPRDLVWSGEWSATERGGVIVARNLTFPGWRAWQPEPHWLSSPPGGDIGLMRSCMTLLPWTNQICLFSKMSRRV